MAYKIDVAKLLGKYIASRQSIMLIDQEIKNLEDKPVYLNFKNVEFISRSPADELNKYLKKNSKIHLVNLPQNVEKMLYIVNKTLKPPKSSNLKVNSTEEVIDLQI